MRIFEYRRAHALLAHHRAQSRQRHIQPRGLRRLRREQSQLHLALRPASARSVSRTTAACGGCAPISSCSSLSRNFRSVDGTAGRIAHPCVPPPSSRISAVSERSASARPAARATRQSIIRAPTKSRESICSTGVSNSQNSSSENSASIGSNACSAAPRASARHRAPPVPSAPPAPPPAEQPVRPAYRCPTAQMLLCVPHPDQRSNRQLGQRLRLRAFGNHRDSPRMLAAFIRAAS